MGVYEKLISKYCLQVTEVTDQKASPKTMPL